MTDPIPARASARWLNRTVAGAGLTSALGDFCYETTTVILPGFLAVLGIPAAGLGLIEGSADAIASFTRMGAGYIADRLGHRKALVVLGYALTPVGQVLIALAFGWPLLLLGRAVSWFGKGLRGPLRDAIVIQAVSAQTRGRAFGFHRAADTIGAVAGPLLGVVVLGWAQHLPGEGVDTPFRIVLWLSLIPGVLSALSFGWLVRDPKRSPNPGMTLLGSLRGWPVPFRRYLRAVALFGIGDYSHSLLILAATVLLTSSMGVVHAAQVAGLLFVGRNVVQLLASYPVGLLADRVGHRPMLQIGYALGALTGIGVALAFALPHAGPALLAGVFALAGMHVAIEETLEPTVAAELVGSASLATSYGAMGTVNGVAKFVSSGMVGLVWTLWSPMAAFMIAATLMTAGTLSLGAVDSPGAMT